ncbi:MAG: M48 family metallopeptidase [bacterium]
MWNQIHSNRRKSILLTLIMGGVLVGTGYAGGELTGTGLGAFGAALALVVWLVLALVSYYSGDKILLSSSGAKRVTHDDFPALHNVTEEMAIASGFPRIPDVYVINDPSPNAFATGRSPKSASVAVTSGLLTRLNRDELQGVIAHEISHIVNRDVLFMMMLGIMLGAIVMISDVFVRARFYGGGGRRSSSRGGGQAELLFLVIALVLIILAPLIARLIYFAVSRRREYLADACGAQFTRYPEGLASALEKISAKPQQLKAANRVTAPMYIVNPFAKIGRAAVGLFSTHPPTEQRVKLLRSMGGGASLAAYQRAWQETMGFGRPLFTEKDLRSRLMTPKPAAAPAAPALAPVKQAEPLMKRGDVGNFFWKKEGYGIVDCDCGVSFKIPPNFRSNAIFCTRCGKKHDLNK